MALTPKQVSELKTSPAEAGNRIARALELADITQTALADAIGLTNTYVSDTARGRYQTITVENARKFAEYFGVPIEVLFPSQEAA